MSDFSLSRKIIGSILTAAILLYALISIITNSPNYESKNLIELEKEFPVLMEEMVNDIRPPDDVKSRIRPNGYTYLSYDYDMPKAEEINQIKRNIDKTGYWKVVPTRIRDSKNIFMSYCYEDIALNLNRYEYKESSSQDGWERLKITIYYVKDSDCVSNIR